MRFLAGFVGFYDTCVSCCPRVGIFWRCKFPRAQRHDATCMACQIPVALPTSSNVFHGVLELHVIRIAVTDSFHFSSIVELRRSTSTMPYFFLLRCFLHIRQIILPEKSGVDVA